MNHLIQWVSGFNSKKCPLMKNENKKITFRKCFKKMKSPTVLMRAVLSSDKIKGDTYGTGTSHPEKVQTGTDRPGVRLGGSRPLSQYIGASEDKDVLRSFFVLL